MASYTQDNRPLQVSTGLGKDVLLLERFTGEEGVSVPFRFTLEMLSENPAIDPAGVLRKPVSVTAAIPGGKERHYHGIVSRFVSGGRRSGLTAYRAEVVPWLWFLSLTNDCRIFQNQSVTEIAETLFKEAGFTDFKIKVLKPLAQRVYCVQYRESTLAFVSRLLEEEGVFYFFEHEAAKHTLILTDHTGKLPACPEVSKLRMSATDSWAMAEDPVVTSLDVEYAAITGKVTLSSFDYENPTRGLLATVAGKEANEHYDYFGGYTEKPDGERFARLRLELREARQQTLQGESNCASLTSGHKFDLTEHPNKKLNQAYHVLRVHHTASIPNYTTGTAEPFEYTNSFQVIPASVPYRPPLETPRPIVHGTQTAIVTGPAGEEIFVDKLGRVKVHFHWDRLGKRDENSSCWVRVSSAWAGKGYGNFSAPRIGQEVIVDFLEGDPDQPIIVGRVYNGDQTPPCDPGGKGGVISGLRSKTHKGSGFNEMSMDDTAGKEKITIHAQYDMSTTVLHDDSQTVKNDRTITVDGKHTETIKKDTSITVSEGNLTETVSKGTATLTVKKDIGIKSETTFVHISADTEIELKVGAAKLLMKKSGEIELSGKNLAIKGTESVDTKGGTVTSKADTLNKIEGANVISEGKATNTVKGGMVMLNP